MDKGNKQCCNPFNDAHKAFPKLFPITRDLAAKARFVNKRIKIDDLICENCRRKIYNKARAATPKKDEPPAKRTTNEAENLQEMMDVSMEDKSSEEKTSEETTSGEKSELSASNIVLGQE